MIDAVALAHEACVAGKRAYVPQPWSEFESFLQAGVEGQNMVFLFSDNHIVCESFLEDINNMLNSGDVPGMFAQGEKDRIAADLRDWAFEHGYPASKEGCYTAFIDRVREKLHIVLAMSPVGDKFRNRCRQFPALINCCTIDMYTQWPEEALLSVSTQVSCCSYHTMQPDTCLSEFHRQALSLSAAW